MTATARATRLQWAGLALLVLPMLTLSTDLTVLFFALPTLSVDLGASPSQALWIVHVYGFLIAGFLVTMGRLADRVGARRLLLTGAIAFAALSIAAAFSVSAEMLIAIRALLGVAGATLMPSLYSLLRVMFLDDRERRLAIAIMFSAFSAGGAIGPLLGGALLEHFWWGSVFLINVPPMMLLLTMGRRLLPERRDASGAKLDAPSVALSVAGMLAVVYGLQELAAGASTETGPGWLHVAAIVAGVLALTLFVRRQRRLRDPLFDLALLARPRLAVSLVTLLLVGIGIVGTFYLFTQHLQWVGGLSPLSAGLWTVPFVVVNIIGALLAPQLAVRIRPEAVVAGALAVTAVGALLVAFVVGVDASSPLPLVTAMSVTALGQGAAMALVSDLIISGAPIEKTGSAAAAQEVGGELGSALGIAMAGAISVLVYRASMQSAVLPDAPASAVGAVRSSIGEAVPALDRIGSLGAAVLPEVQRASTWGLQVYATFAAVLAAAAAVAVAVVLLGRAKGESHPLG